MSRELNDAAVLAAIGRDGNRTFRLARTFDVDTAQMRARLKRLEREGRVSRHPRYSYSNDIYWVAS